MAHEARFINEQACPDIFSSRRSRRLSRCTSSGKQAHDDGTGGPPGGRSIRRPGYGIHAPAAAIRIRAPTRSSMFRLRFRRLSFICSENVSDGNIISLKFITLFILMPYEIYQSKNYQHASVPRERGSVPLWRPRGPSAAREPLPSVSRRMPWAYPRISERPLAKAVRPCFLILRRDFPDAFT